MISKYLENILDLSIFQANTETVARELIGKTFVRSIDDKLLSGIIVETEAYLSTGDLASHSAVGQTNRNSAMFMDAGTVYVYKIYGLHNCVNVVTEPRGIGASVLIRAIQVIDGFELMQENRGISDIKKLCNGPGNLCKALNIDSNLNKSSFLSDKVFISAYNSIVNPPIKVGKRVGISKSKDLELRFQLSL